MVGGVRDSTRRDLLKQATVLLVVRVLYRVQVGGGRPEGIGIALCECSHDGSECVDIVDADFFDGSLLVIAFRSQEEGTRLRQSVFRKQLIERGLDHTSSVGTANYGGLEYQERSVDVKGLTRERLLIDALNEWRDGKVRPALFWRNKGLAGC